MLLVVAICPFVMYFFNDSSESNVQPAGCASSTCCVIISEYDVSRFNVFSMADLTLGPYFEYSSSFPHIIIENRLMSQGCVSATCIGRACFCRACFSRACFDEVCFVLIRLALVGLASDVARILFL